MKRYNKLMLLGDVFCHENYVEDVTIKRISPRCYRMGERAGFYAGLGIGFTAGVAFICVSLGLPVHVF